MNTYQQGGNTGLRDSGTPRDSKGTPTGLQRVSGGSLGSEGLQWDSGGTPEGLRWDFGGTPRDSEGLESAVSPLPTSLDDYQLSSPRGATNIEYPEIQGLRSVFDQNDPEGHFSIR